MARYRNKGNSIIIAVAAAAGAVLMALAVAIVFALRTGIVGAVLVALVIIVAAFSGWFVGMLQQVRENNHAAYMQGYNEGLKKKTLVIRQPGCSILVRMPDTEELEAAGCVERSQ